MKTFVLNTYRRCEVVDSYMDWIAPLARKVRLLINPWDTVVSTSMPNSAHVGTLIGLFRRSNYWIADFGDPWILNASQPRKGIRLVLENFLESRVVERADLVTFTTERTRRDYAERYPAHRSKFAVARMGHDPVLVSGDTSSTNEIFYGGALQADNRDASAVLRAIPQHPTWQFVFAGVGTSVVRDFYGDELPSNVTLSPWLNHPEYVQAASRAHACLVFGNSNPQQIPGKVYQLMPVAQRILYVQGMPTEDDEALTLEGLDAVLVQPTQASVEHAISNLGSTPTRQARGESSSYTWEAVMRPLREAVAAQV